MFINITNSETGSNKSSSAQLVEYLEKENKLKADNIEKELWFTNDRYDVPHQEVRVKLDNNVAKLSKTDDKFFLVNISPSEKEILFLKQKYTEELLQQKLKEYAIAVMDAYALNFKKDSITSSKDLLWFGKLEHYKYYSSSDDKVKNGEVSVGEIKEGEQMHLQIIVSRKDITNKIKLSPKNNSRGKNPEHSAKFGQFDNLAFKERSEKIFDSMFNYQRELKEKLAYSITMDKGSVEEKKVLNILMQIEDKLNDSNKEEYFRLIDSVSLDISLDFKIFESKGAGLLASLLTTENSEYIENIQLFKKKKLRKSIDLKIR
ncbi:DUF5712 family protein [Myroides profundi]|uniref:Molybdopterin-guanine dinucleotide biosynthesis protein MobB n=1 Tax=Myroides profundi TaxID=480520 RepID=A0AAJ4W3S3_MYRPR|nr:DUF5712 family protein [Myroides profundi]AJH15850.1 molybdopterin-guanine dinucleotide biosynthesis protein MobB [Myroides profundi]SEQ73229.1 hypothetical protein SAMN04488089_105186 [Myroides profundi]